MKNNKHTLKIILFCLIFLIVILISEISGFVWSRNNKFTSCQPQEVIYKSNNTYCLHVIKLNQTLSSRDIVIISKKTEPDYGFVFNFPTPNIISDEEYDKLKIHWRGDGLELVTIFDLSVFIPAKNFTKER